MVGRPELAAVAAGWTSVVAAAVAADGAGRRWWQLDGGIIFINPSIYTMVFKSVLYKSDVFSLIFTSVKN